jgi:hypothetical protein
MQRDYFLRLIEQVGEFLKRAIRQRRKNTPQEALQSIMAACERLFAMDAVRLFQFLPDRHFLMLTEGEPPEIARDKVLIYAALNREAGQCYVALNQAPLARQSFLNALRFTLRARQTFPAAGWPDFAPSVAELLDLLGDAPLDPDTAALLEAAMPSQLLSDPARGRADSTPPEERTAKAANNSKPSDGIPSPPH